jgi:REP element-mobilizing transposase RayT
MSHPEPLQPGAYYHIYNRGVNREPLFREPRNYTHFLNLYGRYIEPVAETFAYCLMNNHFHFLLRVRSEPTSTPSRQFNNLFIAYAKAFNRAFQRTGALFESPFKRRVVESDRYFTALVAYIHRNPQQHGFVDDFRDWPYTSYHAIRSNRPSRVQSATVLDWFDGLDGFEDAHVVDDVSLIEPLIADDWT